jgi:membrane-associated phospholipid phosphatase
VHSLPAAPIPQTVPTTLKTPRPSGATTTAPTAAAALPTVRRPAAQVALVYMALSFPLLFMDGLAATPWVMVFGHLTALGGLVWAVRRRGPSVLADWLPLLLTAFFYVELPALIAGLNPPRYHDAVVQGWDMAIFGFQPSHEWAGRAPWVVLSEAVHLGYLSYYFMIFGPPLLLYVAGRKREFAGAQLAIIATFVVCYICFILFPVEGPRYGWPAPPGIPDGPLRSIAVMLLEGGSSRGTAFPSSHAAVAVASAIGGLRYQFRIGVLTSVLSVLLVLGAVYGGYHYAIDMIVGVMVGALVSTLVLRRYERTHPA